jgi:hypothetical protein
VWFEEDGTHVDADQRRRDAPGADGHCVSPGVQSLAAPTDPLSETFAPEQGFAPQALAFLRNVAPGPYGHVYGIAPSAMALADIKSVPLPGGCAIATVFPI